MGAELVSEDLRLAARALGRITGSIDAEDLLDRIFSQFCVENRRSSAADGPGLWEVLRFG